MFKLTNAYGTVTVTAASETDRDRLIRSGYKPVAEKEKSAVKKKTADDSK